MLDMIIWFHHTSNATDADGVCCASTSCAATKLLNPSQLLSLIENGVYHIIADMQVYWMHVQCNVVMT